MTQSEFNALMDGWVAQGGGNAPGTLSLPDEVAQEFSKLGGIVNTLAQLTGDFANGTASLSDELKQTFAKQGDILNGLATISAQVAALQPGAGDPEALAILRRIEAGLHTA